MRAVAWVLAGACTFFMLTIFAVGLSANDRLLGVILTDPVPWIKFPSIVGAIAGWAAYIIRDGKRSESR